MYLNGEIETEEEYKARLAEIQNHYFGENGILTTYSHLYNIAVQTDAKATEDFWAKEYGLMTSQTEDWKNRVDEYLIDIQVQTDAWKEVSTQANDDVKNALEDSETATENLTIESEKLKDKILDDVIPALGEELTAIGNTTKAYSDQRAELKELIRTYEEYLTKLNTQVKNEIVDFAEEKPEKQEPSNSDSTSSGTTSTDKPIVNNTPAKDTNKGSYKVQNGDTLSSISQKVYGTVNKWPDLLIKNGFIEEDERSKYLQGKYNTDPGHWIFPGQILQYRTGGYTGEWGPEGKLAILHEKELVLNKDDTENLLTTISFIRDLVNMIDAQAGMASLFNMYATSGVMSNSESLEQVVTIHAEFPNASDRYEIEEAFNSLVNRASQYANRK